MVAAVCAWHEHHEAAADEIDRRLRARESLVVAGGAFYDAVIAACAIKARVRAILTFNLAHFRRYSDEGIEIVAPGT
jgi:predicted nucleic acid-binding protein